MIDGGLNFFCTHLQRGLFLRHCECRRQRVQSWHYDLDGAAQKVPINIQDSIDFRINVLIVAEMKVLLQISAVEFDHLLGRCERSSHEFQILISGCIDSREKGEQVERVAEVLCEEDEAKQLLELATKISVDAAHEIATSLDLFRRKETPWFDQD